MSTRTEPNPANDLFYKTLLANYRKQMVASKANAFKTFQELIDAYSDIDVLDNRQLQDIVAGMEDCFRDFKNYFDQKTKYEMIDADYTAWDKLK